MDCGSGRYTPCPQRRLLLRFSHYTVIPAKAGIYGRISTDVEITSCAESFNKWIADLVATLPVRKDGYSFTASK
jgi:hypothetical protein